MLYIARINLKIMNFLIENPETQTPTGAMIINDNIQTRTDFP